MTTRITSMSRREALALATKAGLGTMVLSPASFAQTGTVPTSGTSVPELKRLDELLVDYLHNNSSLASASLAVARNGRVIYARAFGYADVEARLPADPSSLFRIASVSKTFTSAAIMLLVQRGRLRLTDPVFPLLALEMPFHERTPLDPRLNSITVHQVLCHTGGWAANLARNPFETWTGFDPMFSTLQIAQSLGGQSPARPVDIVRFMMTRPLDFDPGTHYSYSNFGYCVLGRVIEKVSGRPYADFVTSELFKPLGITDARIGHSLAEMRMEGEVRYYSVDDPTPTSKNVFGGKDVVWRYGGFQVEAMDSHGGWIATASDLARFGAALDITHPNGPLNGESIDKMFSRPSESGTSSNGIDFTEYYGYGWHVNSTEPEGRSEFHGGNFSGTSAFLMRRQDGVVWATIFNSTVDNQKQLPAIAMAPAINASLASVKAWPV
jgi:N-acyl-D-amino-acid deacylase